MQSFLLGLFFIGFVKITIPGYVHTFSAYLEWLKKVFHAGIEIIRCASHDKDSYSFFLTLNTSKHCHATLFKIRRPERDILVFVKSPVTVYKSKFSFIAFRKLLANLD